MKKRTQKHHIQPQLQDQAVWMSTAAVFLLFFIAFISFTDHSSLTGSAVQNIAYVQAGKELSMEVQEIPGLRQYTIQLTQTVKNSQIVVTQNQALPFDRNFISKFTFSSPDAEKIGATILFLKIKESDLLQKGISRGDLRLFHDGKEIPTSLTQQKDGYLYYTAPTTGLGDFVIGKAVPVITAPAPVQEQPTAEEASIAPTTGTAAPPQAESMLETGPLMGEAAQQPGQAQRGFWARIRNFFGRLWG